MNVATIVSNETPPDDGEDSIIVTSESELGGTPTPTPSVPNTALVFGPAGEPISIPVELLGLRPHRLARFAGLRQRPGRAATPLS